MPLWYDSFSYAVFHGDALTELRGFRERTFNCCVTSPPYWGLRDYGTAEWEGGSVECDHLQPAAHGYNPFETSTLGPKRDGIAESNSAHADGAKRQQYKESCGKCGATRIDRQLGLEKTPEEYVAKMVEVFREVRRVLRDDGTLWLNIGDSYAGSGKGAWNNKNGGQKEVYIPDSDSPQALLPKVPDGLKPKDLVGIPWMLAFALRADGWYLRSDIIWSKPNTMPSSVRDRCTVAHEYVFMLTKSARYYFDQEAIKEPSANSGKVVSLGERSFSKRQADGAGIAPSGNGNASEYVVKETRNRRSVWTIPTSPFPEAHFATFPPKLIEPCILAGCPPSGLVLDPFAGSGTTLAVAKSLSRCAVGIELQADYLPMIQRRIEAAREATTVVSSL